MLMVNDVTKSLGACWRPASISSKLNLVRAVEPNYDDKCGFQFAYYTPVMFHR